VIAAYRACVPGSRAQREARERILRLCRSVPDARTLRVEVLEELRRVVAADAYAWVLTDPSTCVGASPLADVPWLAELPRQIRLKYLTPVNRWTSMTEPVALLDEVTGGDLSRSRLWDEMLGPYGVCDAASVVFRDRYGCWAFLELWRSGDAPRFDRAEARFLADLAEPLTTAVRRCLANTFAVRPEGGLPPVGPVVLLLTPELEVRGQTPATMEYLRVLVPPDEGRRPVPAAAYNVAAQLLAEEAGVDAHPPSARVHLSEGRWMTVRAARIEGPEPLEERDIAVTIEEASAGRRIDLFARTFGLSARERELVGHLAGGDNTREIARRMILSENTIQDHLKAVFDKTAARSRGALLARALGSTSRRTP
jgi:DNA-binding CsgD family transcriptional regulator